MAKRSEITFTRAKTAAFLKAYNDALEMGKKGGETFVFEGDEFVVNYAYYALEHLSNNFNEPRFKPERRADG